MAATSENNTHTEVGTQDAHGGGTFPPFDPSTFASQLLWLAITFGIFYYLMAKIVLPRIRDILEVRGDRIAQDLDEAHRLKEESDAALAAYEQELAEARNKAHGIAQEARDRAKAEADAERSSVERELSAKLEEAEQQIATIKQSAMAEVGVIAEDTTATLVNELLGGELSKAEIATAISRAAGGQGVGNAS